MTQATATSEKTTTFRVRATFAPLTHIELIRFEPAKFEQELNEKVRQAPMFFRENPLVLSLERLAEPQNDINFSELMAVCARARVRPIAIRGGSLKHQQDARAIDLLVLPPQKQVLPVENEPLGTSPAPQALKPEDAKASVELPVKKTESPAPVSRQTKVINQPVRSGQQIYAPNSDLIVLAPVSAGAEILADGHIHVYAALRGRALAGVLGDTSARIFCRSLEAELVSIAGQYKISEDLQNSRTWRQTVQIFLVDDKLTIEPI
jgi:septum site-determining protein MinC